MMPAPAQPGDPPPGPTLIDRLLGRRVFRLDADGNAIPETLPERVARLAPPTTIFALSISLAFHLLALVIAGLIGIGVAQAGGAGSGDAPIEMAIVTESELGELQQAGIGGDLPEAPKVPLAETETIELLGTSPVITDAGLSETIDITATVGGGDVGGALGLGGPGGGIGGGAGGGAATFFGAEARGTRFAYIVDVSGSMGYDGKIESLKRELARSVEALLENAHFFVCPFSSGAAPLEGRRDWLDASDGSKLRARRAIAALQAEGSTIPGPAFEIVFTLRPRPDAIYFMTDGLFDPAVAVDLVRLNAETRIPIHCITFVNKESESLMRKIAEDSGGTYSHVPGPGGKK